MSLRDTIKKLVVKSKKASIQSAVLSTDKKNKILKAVAQELRKSAQKIQIENQKDLDYAKKAKLSSAMIDRLTLDPSRIEGMASSVEEVQKLEDPIAKILGQHKTDNGLKIRKVSVPLGVIVIIYESRPNVTSECASLCIKSGNAVVLRGGKEAFHSNKIITSIYRKVLKKFGVSEDVVSLVQTTDRAAVDFLIQMEGLVNLVIPRGGETLIQRVVQNSRVPVIKHYKGICHVYIDKDADLKQAEKIAVNAKVQRPGVCNACETLLVHKSVAKRFLPLIEKKLIEEGCEIRGDVNTKKILKNIKKASKEDWSTEYLDLILSIRTVDSIEEAIDHIQTFGSGHTEAIVTKNKKAEDKFVRRVDSSSVMVNASTRFADGNQYGLGAEIGISTDKIHARGPMGLEGLTSYKYVVFGKGQIRS